MATLVQPRAPAPTTTPEPKPRAPTVAPTEQLRAPAAAQTEQPRAPAAAPTVVEQPREAPAAVDTKEAATTTRTATDVHADHASGRKDSTCIESKFPVLVVVGVQFFSLFVSFVFRVSSFVSWTGEVDCVLHLTTNVCVFSCSTTTDQQLSPGSNGSLSPAGAVRNVKAETIAEAHRERVESEAQTYLHSESRKAEAHAATAQVTQQTTIMSGSRIPGTKEEESKLCVSHVQNLRSKTLGAFVCVYVCVSLVMSESEKQNPRSSLLSLSLNCLLTTLGD